MGFRYRKSFNLGKFLRINMSKSGISTSFKIGRATINPKKNRVTIKTPIKGLSYVKKLKKKK